MANFEEAADKDVPEEKDDYKVDTITHDLKDLDLRPSTGDDDDDDDKPIVESFEDIVKYQHQKSQLSIIFDLLGTPSSDEIRHCDKRTRKMLLSMEKKRGKV